MDFARLAGRRGTALAGAVLALGLATGAAASATLAHAEREAASARLAQHTQGVRGALDATIARYADTMHDVVAVAAGRSPDASGDAAADAAGDGARDAG